MWINCDTIVFNEHVNIQIDTTFMVISAVELKLWVIICCSDHLGGHLGFLKMLNDAIFASFRSSIYRSQRIRINKEQLCGLHFSVKP